MTVGNRIRPRESMAQSTESLLVRKRQSQLVNKQLKLRSRARTVALPASEAPRPRPFRSARFCGDDTTVPSSSGSQTI